MKRKSLLVYSSVLLFLSVFSNANLNNNIAISKQDNPNMIMVDKTNQASNNQVNSEQEEDIERDESVTEAPKKVKNYTHKFLEENEIPTLAFITPPAPVNSNPNFVTRDAYKTYKEAELDIIVPCYERPEFKESIVKKAIDYCNDLELIYFSNDGRLRCAGSEGTNNTIEQYEEIIKNAWYINEPCYGGIATKDEPNVNDFAEMAKGKIATKNVTPDALYFSTLYPSGATNNMLQLGDKADRIDFDTYTEYVSKYVAEVNPDILIYDHYLWHTRTQGFTQDKTFGFFRSLSLFKNKAKEYNIPFWISVAAYKHAYGRQYSMEEQLWIVNSQLAYGAKGLQYYFYWPTIEGYGPSWMEEPLISGMVTGNGTPHDAYYRIQEINKSAKAVDHVLMPATHIGLMQFGEQIHYIQEIDLLDKYGPLVNITGGDSLVGCFENEGKEVYYVTNNSITAGTNIYKCDFEKKVNVRITNLNSGTKTYENVYSVAFRLSAGEAMLVEVL